MLPEEVKLDLRQKGEEEVKGGHRGEGGAFQAGGIAYSKALW